MEEKTLADRACSESVRFISFPFYLISFVIDLPLGLIEFLSGYQPFKDPLVSSLIFTSEKGELWVLRPSEGLTGYLVLERYGTSHKRWLISESRLKESEALLIPVQYRSTDLKPNLLSRNSTDKEDFLKNLELSY